MIIEVSVSAVVERTEGKFASREELTDKLVSELEGADPGSLSGENGGEYEVTDWSVTESSEAGLLKRVARLEKQLERAEKRLAAAKGRS